MYNKYWYDEENIKKIVIAWLESIGFNKKPKKEEKIHGIDIQRRHKKRCRYWFIECKGYPSKSYKRKKGIKPKQIRLAQRYDWFISALGQIALRMKQAHGLYGVAFPYKDYFRDKILDKSEGLGKPTFIKIFRQRTKLYFFLINRRKEIFKLTPNSSKFKKLGKVKL